MPTTRIVIDMQPTFSAANLPDVVAGVAHEITAGRAAGDHILFLEYKGMGPTHRGLLDLVKGYSRSYRVVKAEDDGSSKIVWAIDRYDLPCDHFRLCGVNTDCCVQSTIYGLLHDRAHVFPNLRIELVKAACGTARTLYGHRYDWRKHPRHRNLKLA